MKKSIVIIPVYNEGPSIGNVALKTLEKAGELCDILFINDGSTDSSRRILDSLSNKYPSIHCLHQELNQGYGNSLIKGFEYAVATGYEWILTMDCDEQHQPSDIIRFLDADPSADIVSGSRYLADSEVSGRAPADRVEINRRITSKLNEIYGFHLTDSFCGFKRYKRAVLERASFSELGYAFPMEFWAYASKNNYSILELAVAKIYITDDRSFGQDLDQKRKRYKYYLHAWKQGHEKWFGTVLSLFHKSKSVLPL